MKNIHKMVYKKKGEKNKNEKGTNNEKSE